jgi:uncharacterized protein
MRLRPFAAAFICCLSITASAQGEHHSLWSVQGAHNTVYLLGSVHVLKLSDSALPAELMRAYDSSKALVMEVDVGEIMTALTRPSVVAMKLLPAGQTLAMAMGTEIYPRFVAQARDAGLDPDFMTGVQPWAAALTLQQVEFALQGFDPSAGVDMQLASRARADGKPITGLETLEDEYQVFNAMSLEEQRQFVLKSLEDRDNSQRELDAIIKQWRAGDAKGLETAMAIEFRDFPALLERLTIDRNRKWMPAIDKLLDSGRDYLVVVGVLHLIGKDGIVAMLKAQGHDVVQH